MPSYKLIYFNFRGVGETSRMLFAAAGVEYEDFRITSAQWPALKPTMPFGQLPVLEVDGEPMPQSRAIENYLAREFGLYGSDSWEAATIDVVNETVWEFKPLFVSLVHTEDPKERQELITELSEKLAPKLLANLEKYLKKNNNGGDGWFVGNSLSYADVVAFTMLEFVVGAITEDALKNFPKLKAHMKRVSSHQGIATWLKNRPVTPF